MAEINCDLCQTERAIFMLGNMETGDQTAFCAADFARAGLESAKLLLSPEEILATLGIPVAPADGAPQEPKSGKRGRKREPESEPDASAGTAVTEGVAEPSPAPENV